MTAAVGNLDILSRKSGFNAALRHFKRVTGFISPVTAGANLADLISDAVESGQMERAQMAPTVSALLVDKFDYRYRSANVTRTIEDASSIAASLAEWSAIQIVLTYEHPQAGLFVINPKNESSWEGALPVLRDELVVVYVQSLDEVATETVLGHALEDVYRVLDGVEVKPRKGCVSEKVAQRPPVAAQRSVPSAATAAGGTGPSGETGRKRRMTPRYSVVVTNELFHNGNVEAWKRIIASYRQKYPSLDVLIWYDNERINDINALFKWGKVKHGTPILVSVVGDDIKDVSKLQRYLFEGASPRFEMFLKGSIDQPLDLF
jgi:hypothetical protein